MIGGQVDVADRTGVGLGLLEHGVEAGRLDVEHGTSEHLEQTPIRVPRESLVASGRSQALDGAVVQSDVQDRLHHSGHRELRARPHRDQQWRLGVTQAASDLAFELSQVSADLFAKALWGSAQRAIGAAGVSGNREPGGYRKPQSCHLGQVGALAAQEVSIVLAAFGEPVHVAHDASPGFFDLDPP